MTAIVAGVLFAVPVLALAAALVFVGKRLVVDPEAKELRDLRSQRKQLIVQIREDSAYESLVESRMRPLAVLDQRIKDLTDIPEEESDFIKSLRKGRAKVQRSLAENVEGGFTALAQADRERITEIDAEIARAQKSHAGGAR